MDEITVHLFVGTDGHYHYRIYDCAPEFVADNWPLESNICEMSMSTALGIAIDNTKAFLRRRK